MARTDPLQPLIDVLGIAEKNGLQSFTAADLDAAVKSAVRAVLPGRQQKGNLAEPLAVARKAFVRTLRRRALR